MICVNDLETNEIQKKVCLAPLLMHQHPVACSSGLTANHDFQTLTFQVNLLLTSSGAKIKPLKNLTLEAAPGAESARGIWSSIHDQAKPAGGYRI